MFDTEEVYQKHWQRVANEHGIALDDSFKKEIMGSSGQAMMSIISRHFHTDDPESIRMNCFTGVREDLKKYVPLKPGIQELLAFLQKEKCPMAVASSSSIEQITSNLRVSGLAEYFDEVISGAGLPHGKPAPDIFLLAAEKLGMDPVDCYVLEDSPNGVAAGLAAGALTIMVPDQVQPDETLRKKAHIFPTLHEVKKAMEKGIV